MLVTLYIDLVMWWLLALECVVFDLCIFCFLAWYIYEAYSESKGRLVSKKNIFVRHIFY